MSSRLDKSGVRVGLGLGYRVGVTVVHVLERHRVDLVGVRLRGRKRLSIQLHGSGLGDAVDAASTRNKSRRTDRHLNRLVLGNIYGSH